MTHPCGVADCSVMSISPKWTQPMALPQACQKKKKKKTNRPTATTTAQLTVEWLQVSQLLSSTSAFPSQTASPLPGGSSAPAWRSPDPSQMECLHWSRVSRERRSHLLHTSYVDLCWMNQRLNFSLHINKLWLFYSQASRKWAASKPATCLWWLFGAGWLPSASPFCTNRVVNACLKPNIQTEHFNLFDYSTVIFILSINYHFNEEKPYLELLYQIQATTFSSSVIPGTQNIFVTVFAWSLGCIK